MLLIMVRIFMSAVYERARKKLVHSPHSLLLVTRIVPKERITVKV